MDTTPRVDRARIQWPTALEQHSQALRRLRGKLDEATERALQAAHQISVSEYLALSALAHSDDGGHLRQRVLADAIPLNHSSVSRLVGRLERAGLSERYLCETDRRGVYTQITEQGRLLARTARATYLQALRHVLGAAEQDPELAPCASFVRARPAAPGQD